MGLRLFFLHLSILFATTSAAWADETPFLHIRVNGIKITDSMQVPNADYDIAAITGTEGISILHVFGKNMWNQALDLYFIIDQIKGQKQEFVPTRLPGAPKSFSATVAQDFAPRKGGLIQLHALSDWKFMWLKHYGYKDVNIMLELEGKSVRASLVNGAKLEKISKMTVDVGLIGASLKTQ